MTTIMITGAGRGIGFELARQALEKGWNVIGSVRTPEAQRELAEKLPGMAVLCFDVSDQVAMEKVSNAIQRPIDVLVNNAGVFGPRGATVADVDCDALVEVYRTNVIAPIRVVQTFLPFLKASENARVVTISSRMGLTWAITPDSVGYRSSKAAVNAVMQVMAGELKADGISCVAMHPGWVQTEMGGAAADITPTESAAGILEVIDKMTLSDTGQFINYDGERWDW